MEFDDVRSTEETVCATHITDPFLLSLVTISSESGECGVCRINGLSPDTESVNLGDLALVVHEFALRHFDTEGLWVDNEQQLDPLGTEEVVGQLLDGSVQESDLDLLRTLVAELITEPVDWFEIFEPSPLEFEWDEFERTVKHTSRLLLPPTGEQPASPPEQAHEFMTSLLVFAEDRAGFVQVLAPGATLYRSRTDRDVRALEKAARNHPAQELGPAPQDRALAGRMNAQGIPIFYVALDEETACAEVASHSPYSEAVVGQWTLMQPLRVLDLTTVPRSRSVFEQSQSKEAVELGFFSEFVDRITRPVIVDGNHPVDYAPTQVLTEFFRWAARPRLDGILYPSRVRDGGVNAALFFGESIWFSQHGEESGSISSHLRWDARGTDETLFEIDPGTIRRFRLERSISVTKAWF